MTVSEPPPAPPWAASRAALDDWLGTASASELRQFVEWGSRVLAASEPIGFPEWHQESEPPPPTVRAPKVRPPEPQVYKPTRGPVFRIEDVPAELRGPVLREARRSRGLSQDDVFGRIGVHRSVVQMIEQDRRVTLSVRQELADLYATVPEVGPKCCEICEAVLESGVHHWRQMRVCAGCRPTYRTQYHRQKRAAA